MFGVVNEEVNRDRTKIVLWGRGRGNICYIRISVIGFCANNKILADDIAMLCKRLPDLLFSLSEQV